MSESEETCEKCCLASKPFNGVRISRHDAAEAFYKLASLFYEQNFGTLSKQEFEIQMFKYFLSFAEQQFEESEITDFFIAKKLGITPQVVRNRKTKLFLKEGIERDWRDSLISALKSKAYVFRERSSGWEMKVMLPSKLDVYGFEDALMAHGHYFDNSFNNLVVIVSMTSLIALMLESIEGISVPNEFKGTGLVDLIKTKTTSKITNPDLRRVYDQILTEKLSTQARATGKSLITEGLKKALRKLNPWSMCEFMKELHEDASSIIGSLRRSDMVGPDVDEYESEIQKIDELTGLLINPNDLEIEGIDLDDVDESKEE